MFKQLAKALEMAQRVDEVERRVEVLSREWTDFVDLMRNREERQRQRDKKALRGLVEPRSPDTPSPTLPTPAEQKAELRRAFAASRGKVHNVPTGTPERP